MARHAELIERERYLLLRGILEDRRREIHEKLRTLRESIPVDTPDVCAVCRNRASTTSCRRSTSPSCRWMKSETLKKIDLAILRLEEGTYGRCQDCDAEIRRPACAPFPSRPCAATARRRRRATFAPSARRRPSSACSASWPT